MKRLPTNENRLRTNNSRFPVDLIIKDKGVILQCKYCGRKPLVERFDFIRVTDGKKQVCCVECYDAGRAFETNKDTMIGLGYALSGLKEYDFPLAPPKGTLHKEFFCNCDTCGRPIYRNPYKKILINAYHELLRDGYFHEKCGV